MKVRDAIARLGNYQPPLEGRDPSQFLLMDFNESPLPPPPHVLEALTNFIHQQRLQVYPAYGNFLELLSEYTGVSEDQLILTNGSDQAIDIVLRAFLEEGDSMVMARPGFSMFFQIAGTLGAHIKSPVYGPDLQFPLDAISDAIDETTKLVVIINPNNPTGTSASEAQLKQLLEDHPELPFLIDEAYFEFTQKTSAHLLEHYPNLIILRTFSKALAIPSLRLGYVMGDPSFIEQLYKIRGPYDVNMLSLVAARAQLEKPDEWRAVVQEVMQKSKPKLEEFFNKQKIRFFPGEANFFLVEPQNVQHTVQTLKKNGVLVRPMKPPIEHLFRISVGSLEQVEQFIQIYESSIIQGCSRS